MLHLLDHIEFRNNVLVEIWVVAIPAIALRVEIFRYLLSSGIYFITGNVLMSVFCTHFSWPFYAFFGCVRNGAAVGTSSLPKLGYFSVDSSLTIPFRNFGLLFIFGLSLMKKLL